MKPVVYEAETRGEFGRRYIAAVDSNGRMVIQDSAYRDAVVLPAKHAKQFAEELAGVAREVELGVMTEADAVPIRAYVINNALEFEAVNL
jgi:hypothetical protein